MAGKELSEIIEKLLCTDIFLKEEKKLKFDEKK